MSDATQDNFTRVLLMPGVPDGPGLVHLRWTASGMAGRVVQVYVDRRLYDVCDGDTAETWLHLHRSAGVRIELLAVPLRDAWTEFAGELRGWTPAFVTEAALAIVRDESLPIDSRVIVTVDDGDDAGHRLWPAGVSRSGFGGLFGAGEFGHDAATGPGHGLGEFAVGPFGADGAAWRWRKEDLPPGAHTLSLRIEDSRGRVVGQLAPPQTVTIAAPPRPAENLTIDSTYTLRWD
jgi:hypothetical protein